MFQIKRIRLKKIKQFLKNLPIFLAERFFLTFFVLLIIFLLLLGLIFFKYNVLIKNKNMEISEKPLMFESKLYDDILQIWQNKKIKFENADAEKYRNLFLEVLPE